MLNVDDRLIKEVLPKIKPDAFAVLLSIAIHLNAHTGTAFPSNERLQRLTGLGRNSIEKALRTLKESGLLKSSQERKDGNFGKRILSVTTDFIQIFVVASKCAPFTENGGTVNGGTVEPSTVDGGTNYINQETELINNLEQINEGEEKEDASLFSSSENENQTLKAEKKEKGLQGGAGGGLDMANGQDWSGHFPLSPPFTPTGETIEPQSTRYVKLYDPQEPNLTLIEPVLPAKNGKKLISKTQQEIEVSERVLSYLNEKAGRSFRLNTGENAKGIISQFRQGFTESQMQKVIDLKIRQWGNDVNMRGNINPVTLFRSSNFERYLIEAELPPIPKTQTNGKSGSHITHAGSDLSKYEQKQIF